MAFWPSERGTLRGWRTGAQQDHGKPVWRDWERLIHATLPLVNDPPVIIAMTEGKHYKENGYGPALTAAKFLSATLGRCYDVRVGWHRSGDYGPAIFFDSSAVCLEFWGTKHRTVPRHWRNVADFTVRGDTTNLFRIALDHYDFQDGDVRLREAKNKGFLANQKDDYGNPIRTLYLLDANGTAPGTVTSGGHLPDRDWSKAPRKTRLHKAIQGDDGVWRADTRAMATLVGEWNGTGRDGGAGFVPLCETAHFDQGMPAERAFIPTVNSVGGDQIMNDWVLSANWPHGLVRDSWTIHVPPAGQAPESWPSDHRVQSWAMLV